VKDQYTLRLDEDQAEAYGEDRNVTVSAGAGSGKTTVLAERYVRLITQRNLELESILTLTFTRKAAAEMYRRIFRRLSASDHPRAREALAKFDQARISTLDAFCAALVRGASYQYGISPDFRIDERELTLNAEAAAVEVLMRRRQDPVVCRLVATRSFDAVVKDLLGDLGLNVVSLVRPPDFSAQGRAQIDFIREEITRTRGELNRLGEAILGIDDSQSRSETLAKAKAVLRSRLPLKEESGMEALGDTAAFLASGASFRRPASNVKDPALIALRGPTEALKTGAANLVLLTDTLSFREDILALGDLLDEYASLLLDLKRRKGFLSFRDTGELAVDILSRDRELRSYYKRRIRAVMIDEFQDNNELQKKLLYLLAEEDGLSVPGIPQAKDLAPDKLFFVGDEKQSIYRFRGADVSVFRGLSRELAASRDVPDASPPAPLSLKTNYRSVPGLVAFFNALFPGVFGVSGEASAPEAFEAEYTEMRAAEGAAAPEPFPPVEIYLRRINRASPEDPGEDGGEDGEEVSDTAGEALAAAERISAGISAGDFGYGDLAVLFRTTTHQDEYERVFRQAGIPFSAADPRGVFFEGPANDFYAILRLVLFPRDRNAYGTVLRSPFTGLGNGTFLRIMLDKPGEPFPSDPPESWFVDPSTGLPDLAERARYEQGRANFSALRDRIDGEGIAPVLAFLWYETGYRTAVLHDREARSNLEHFEYLYTLALSADRRQLSIGAFLDELAPLIGSAEKIETGDIPEQRNVVSFMTIHKSKGLEFPVVILANAGSYDRGERNGKPYYRDPRFGPVISLKSEYDKRKQRGLNYFYERGKELARRQTEAELKRLLYVASTRAMKRLLIFGSVKVPREDPDDSPEEGSLLQFIQSVSAGEGKRQSFLTLLGRGFAMAQDRISHYRIIPFKAPGIGEYQRRMAALRQAAAPFSVGETPRPAAGEEALPGKEGLRLFYERPGPSAAATLRRFTSPSQIEAYAAALRSPAASGPSRPGPAPGALSLPPFNCEPYLTSDVFKRTFGTLCHRAVEELLTGTSRGGFSAFLREAGAPEKVRPLMEEEARDLARRFLDSPQGREAAAAPRLCPEFPFILPLEVPGHKPVLVRGSIDLIYEYGGRCIIPDFKTDRQLVPESHTLQMACYRAAAGAFSVLPPETRLVYLRDLRTVPVAPDLEPSALAELAFAAAGAVTEEE
jgi:ATP-dependent helicase/nuclease subunit A